MTGLYRHSRPGRAPGPPGTREVGVGAAAEVGAEVGAEIGAEAGAPG